MEDSEQVLLIGAEGFIGKAIAQKINEMDGCDTLRKSVRHPKTITQSATGDSKTTLLDLNDPSTFDGALKGVTTVIHCARDVGNKNRPEPIGLQKLLTASKNAGVRKFVYFSSVSVYGTATGVIDELFPAAPTDTYGISKLIAETICERAANEKFRVCVLRPSRVFGPFGKEWVDRYLLDLRLGHLRLFIGGDRSFVELVFVDDVADFCYKLTKQVLPEYSVFVLNGDQEITWDYYLQSISTAFGFGRLQRSESPSYHELRRLLRKFTRKCLNLLAIAGLNTMSKAPLFAGLARSKFYQGIMRESFIDQPISVPIQRAKYVSFSAKRQGFSSMTTVEDGLRLVAHVYSGN